MGRNLDTQAFGTLPGVHKQDRLHEGLPVSQPEPHGRRDVGGLSFTLNLMYDRSHPVWMVTLKTPAACLLCLPVEVEDVTPALS